MSQARSMNVWLDSCVRTNLSLYTGSVVPLWQIWERVVALAITTHISPIVDLLQARITALTALTKAALVTLLQTTWGETVVEANFTKNELIEKVLAYEGLWVDLDYTA
jgi:hypothetical protein